MGQGRGRDWLFYGHGWIALAAAALSWQTTFQTTGRAGIGRVHACVLLGTLGVYTLHRYLSFRRAGAPPVSRRYALVTRHPRASLTVGAVALGLAGLLGLGFPPATYRPLLYALPFTVFYLVPLWPGGPRLRDFPYLKMVWVALAWTLVTVSFAGQVAGLEAAGTGDPGAYGRELIVRFLFTLAIALLFDVRDTELDRRQGVRTLAAAHPRVNRWLAVFLCLGCVALTLHHHDPAARYGPGLAYLVAAASAPATHGRRGEDYFAIYLNGLLLLPPALLAIGHLLGTWGAIF